MTTTTTTARRRRWAIALVGLTVAAALTACTGAVAGAPSPTPGAPTPTAPPTVTPTPTVPAEGTPIVVDLETANDADVVLEIVDRSGRLRSARSGSPGDGASAGAGEVRVEQVDATTVRLTWVDFPHDNRLSMWVDEVDGTVRVLIVQPPPTGPTDAMGLDRVLELTFDGPVEADEVVATVQEGLDTPG